MDPLEYMQDPLPLHMSSRASHILLQVSPYYKDLDGEYRGGVIEEEVENEGGGVSVE